MQVMFNNAQGGPTKEYLGAEGSCYNCSSAEEWLLLKFNCSLMILVSSIKNVI